MSTIEAEIENSPLADPHCKTLSLSSSEVHGFHGKFTQNLSKLALWTEKRTITSLNISNK